MKLFLSPILRMMWMSMMRYVVQLNLSLILKTDKSGILNVKITTKF